MAGSRSGHSRINPRLVGAGAAGVMAVFAVAPFAGAATPSPSPTPSAGPTHPGVGKAKPKAPKPAASSSTTAVAPDYGTQKFRVGVQVKSGAYVATDGTPPDGRSTAGSTVHIVEKDSDGTVVKDQTCNTDPSTVEAEDRATYCLFDNTDLRRKARAHGIPFAEGPGLNEYYDAAPGDTVTLTQTTVEPDLVIDPVVQTRAPAVCSEFCFTDGVVFTDPGLPPVAADDSATTKVSTPVDIDVLGNDTSQGAPTSISVTSQPSNGTAVLVGGLTQQTRSKRAASGTQTIRYTPKAGFVGHDQFTYTLTTANGSSVGHVLVAVNAPPPTAVNDSASTTSGVPVTVAVTKNDDAHGGGPLTLKSVGHPHHGTVRVEGKKTVYTSNSGFAGNDKYTYTVSTPYGTATATVTVTVTAPAVSTPTPTPSHSDQPLAVTGVPTATLGELGLALLGIGGIATVVGRRRRRGNHA